MSSCISCFNSIGDFFRVKFILFHLIVHIGSYFDFNFGPNKVKLQYILVIFKSENI